MKIIMSNKELEYIKSIIKLPSWLVKALELNQQKKHELSENECAYLYELCIEKFQKVAFDINYEITEEGKKLENIIDKIISYDKIYKR